MACRAKELGSIVNALREKLDQSKVTRKNFIRSETIVGQNVKKAKNRNIWVSGSEPTAATSCC